MKVFLEDLPWGSRMTLLSETPREAQSLQFLDGARAYLFDRPAGDQALALVTPRYEPEEPALPAEG